MANREFDIVIFGATGYTGRYVIEELSNSTNATGIKWAIAGRNIQKLKESLEIVQKYLGDAKDIRQTAIIKADVTDVVSIHSMCHKAKLILNCAGPYKLYGDVVIEACVENGTHHVDLSGEIKFLETTQAKYFNTAREKGIYIVGPCGFDSIPGDYGISLLKKEFQGDLNSVEYFIELGQGPSGRKVNTGTFLSGVHSAIDHLNTNQYDKMLKDNVFKKDLVTSEFPLYKRFPPLFFSPETKSWCLWFPSPDERIINRSQKFRYEYLNERPIQSNGYLQMHSFFIGLCYIFFACVFALMSLFSFGRKLLAKYPSFFTGGIFSSEGPTRQQVLEGTTKFTLYAKGWKEKLLDPTDKHSTKPDKQMKLTIRGPEPAYSFTSKCMVESGLVILQETDKLPLEGGVLTPGVAFEKTSLRERLEKRGLTFIFENL